MLSTCCHCEYPCPCLVFSSSSKTSFFWALGGLLEYTYVHKAHCTPMPTHCGVGCSWSKMHNNYTHLFRFIVLIDKLLHDGLMYQALPAETFCTSLQIRRVCAAKCVLATRLGHGHRQSSTESVRAGHRADTASSRSVPGRIYLVRAVRIPHRETRKSSFNPPTASHSCACLPLLPVSDTTTYTR